MWKRWVFGLIFVLVAVSASAQTQTTKASKLQWEQEATDLTTANAASYTVYADGATNGTELSGVVCTGLTSPYLCLVAFPAFTPGTHQLTLTVKYLGVETAKSDPLVFTFVVLGVPAHLQVVTH